jgi:hypothetical protein
MNIHRISDKNLRVLIAAILVIMGVSSRLLPHPPNVTSVAAVAIFGGTLLPGGWAVALPLVSMVASDMLIGLHPLIAFTWGSFALIAWLSPRLIKQTKPSIVLSASLLASLLFFVISNLGVWVEGRLYARTLSGLVGCYVSALPFFRNTLLGDLLFTGLLFGTYALAYHLTSATLHTYTSVQTK